MTLTVHEFIQDGGQYGPSVLVGDDFEEILDVVEGDEVIAELYSCYNLHKTVILVYSILMVGPNISFVLVLQRSLQKQLSFSELCLTWGGPLNRIDLGWYFSVLHDSASFLLLLLILVSPTIDSCRELAAMPYRRWRRAGP